MVKSRKADFLDTKNVVSSGNESFRLIKGSAAIPREKLGRPLALRMPTFVLDESRTSKICAGVCGSIMSSEDGELISGGAQPSRTQA